MANLVIVESPAKANTIKAYLGSNYKVIASKGHIRDLPKSTLGIDVNNNFETHYINIRGKGDVIKELKREAKKANKIFLATDPDREGEAISWHIATELGIPEDKECRITFNEITKSAVKEAIKKPRCLNLDLVNSQQARRILDRIVGFSLSEILWKSVRSGLSGGRVQSVAARIVTEREEEIRSFIPREFWTVDVELKTKADESITLRLASRADGKVRIADGEEARFVENAIKDGVFKVTNAKHSKKQKAPQPPFTTSTLQQEASRKLGFQTQRIMKVAQELYDGLNIGSELGGVQGLITYMRTDSLRISDSAKESCKEFIKREFGEKALPKSDRVYKSSANSQDAHEAIRPSNVYITPKSVRKMLTNDQYRLYKLIWERFVASQMESALLDTVSYDVECNGYMFKASSSTVKSRGYMVLYEAIEDEADDEEKYVRLPSLKKDEILSLVGISSVQRFTEPPQRYTEATLIKFLEENGIGRPSTYAPIISIIISRNYVRREGKMLVATPLGEVTTKFMREHFPEIVDYEFTAQIEKQLDSIENRENTIVGVIGDFYKRFEEELKNAGEIHREEKVDIPEEKSDVICDKCGATMVYKNGRYGRFLACPSYPKCKNTKAIDKSGKPVENEPKAPSLAGFKCEICGSDMVIREGKYGAFYACVNYPECKNTKQKTSDTGVCCPKCGGKILARHGKGKMLFYSCENYPECDFSTWDMPLKEKCPDCGDMLYYRINRKQVICKAKNCAYKREEEMTVIE